MYMLGAYYQCTQFCYRSLRFFLFFFFFSRFSKSHIKRVLIYVVFYIIMLRLVVSFLPHLYDKIKKIILYKTDINHLMILICAVD